MTAQGIDGFPAFGNCSRFIVFVCMDPSGVAGYCFTVCMSGEWLDGMYWECDGVTVGVRCRRRFSWATLSGATSTRRGMVRIVADARDCLFTMARSASNASTQTDVGEQHQRRDAGLPLYA